ncbi:YqhA family protein [Chloroflexota bacterium]
MKKLISASRYLVIVAIIGLLFATGMLFIFGGLGLLKMLAELLGNVLTSLSGNEASIDKDLVIIDVVEFIHTFLVGTVLFITAAGLYQLFIEEVNFPDWMKIDSTEELESNLIGLVVVVLAVNFMTVVFVGEYDNLLNFGAGIALPISALGLFLGLRSWSTRVIKETTEEEKSWREISENTNDGEGFVQDTSEN